MCALSPATPLMSWDADPYQPQELSDHAYLITWERMSTDLYYRAYTPGGRLLDAGGGQAGHARCREACEVHLAGSRRAGL